MATGHQVLDLSYKAAADLSSHQYKFVYHSAAETVNLCGANGKALGILQNAPDAANKPARVRVIGVSQLIVNEACATGKYLTSTSTGLGEIADAANELARAFVLEAATAQNDRITVLLCFIEVTGSDA